MTDDEMRVLLGRTDKGTGATEDDIRELESRVGFALPADYKQFLRISDGIREVLGNECFLALWSCEEVPKFNSAYRSSQRTPGYLMFGDDGGGESFGFDTRKGTWNIVCIPFISDGWPEAKAISSTFSEFLRLASTGRL